MRKPSVLRKNRIPDERAWNSVLRLFFWFPEVEFSLTEVAEKAKVSKSTANRVLYGLMELGWITIREDIVYRIKANIDNISFKRLKIGYNLKFLMESEIVQFLEKALNNPRTIILYGSYRWAEEISTSDIDIAVETSEDIDVTFIRQQGIERYERRLAHKIQIMKFNRKRVNINVFNNIANGIVLSGYLEVNP